MNDFEKNIIHSLGLKGETWLTSLLFIIKTLSQEWSLTDIQPIKKMNWNYVAMAITKANLPVVLKISADKNAITNEYTMLKMFNGQGFIQVLAFNETYNAMLLEKAVSGISLKEKDNFSWQEKVKIYSQLVTKMATIKHSQTNTYPPVSTWLEVIDKITDPCIEPQWVKCAQFLKSHLLATAQDTYLCHADLHFENIIQQGSDWVAIDPKGIYGEMAFEAAASDLISTKEISYPHIQAIILERVHLLAGYLNLDPQRLLSWIFLRIILSIQWFIEDKGEPSHMIDMAGKIYPLVKIC